MKVKRLFLLCAGIGVFALFSGCATCDGWYSTGYGWSPPYYHWSPPAYYCPPRVYYYPPCW